MSLHVVIEVDNGEEAPTEIALQWPAIIPAAQAGDMIAVPGGAFVYVNSCTIYLDSPLPPHMRYRCSWLHVDGSPIEPVP